MIRRILVRVLNEYASARESPFAGHPLSSFIRTEAPTMVRSAANLGPEFIVEGSPGKGNWVAGPWVAVLDPLVTESAQEGYYPVYLFAPSMERVYLSFNQGVTTLKEEIGTPAARVLLESRAAILASRLAGSIPSQFSPQPIDLTPRSAGSLPELYERGHVFGRAYSRDHIPSDDVLVEDLRAMLNVYRRATAMGGTADLAESEDLEGEASENKPSQTLLEEKRRYRYHRRLERNRRLANEAKRIHGCVCWVCGFDFGHTYGAIGEGYIEAHHLTPLSELPMDGLVQLSPKDDFQVVCANCHRMIHRKGAPKTMEAFAALFRKQLKEA